MLDFRRLIAAAVVFAFLPFAAIDVAGVALQVAIPLTACASIRGWRQRAMRRPALAATALAAPAALSCLVVILLRPEADAARSFRVTLAIVMSAMSLLLGGLARLHLLPSTFLRCVAGACAAHVLFGLVQVRSFAAGRFPFASWFRSNPELGRVAEVAEDYALYIQRPFGWLPEPSSAGAALGAALVWLLWSKRTRYVDAWYVWPTAAAVGWLLAASRTRAIVPLLAAVAWVSFARVGTKMSRRPSMPLRGILAIAVLLPAAAAALAILRSRVGDDSLLVDAGRSNLLADATSVVLDGSVADIVFGVGPGQMAERVATIRGSFTGIPSVWLTMLLESGVFFIGGAATLTVLVTRAARRQDRSSWALPVFIAFALAVVTSYSSVMPPLLFLGWFLAAPPRLDRRDEIDPGARRQAVPASAVGG